MCDYTQYTDEELIQKLRSGEDDIQDYLMEKYKYLVKNRSRAMYLIGGETDDLIQEGMIGLFKAVRDYNQEKDASFSTFARLCIERQLYSAIQASNRQKNQPLNTYVSLSEETGEAAIGHLWEDSPESILVDQAAREDRMKKIIGLLSPFEMHVLELYLGGNDYQQIADMIDKTPKSIDNALQRIKVKVRSI